MKYWFFLSLISAVCGSIWSISVKYGLQYFSVNSFALWYSLISTIIITFYYIIKYKWLHFSIYGVLSGMFAGIATLLLAKSFSISPNPGFSMAIFRTQAISTALCSSFFFGARLNLKKYLGILLSISGVATIVTAKLSIKHKDEKEDYTNETNTIKSKYKWVLYSFLAGVSMTIKDLFTKKRLYQSDKKKMGQLLWATSFFQTITLIIIVYFTSKSIKLKEIKKVEHLNTPFNKYTIFAGIAFSIYQLFIIKSCKEVSNIGLVKSIDSLGIVITTIASIFIFNSLFDTQSIIGVLMIIIGVLDLS